MNRTDYRTARRMHRENGDYAFRWMSDEYASVIRACKRNAETDPLSFRATILRELGPRGLANEIRFQQTQRAGRV